MSPAGRPRKNPLTNNHVLRYKDTRVLFIKQLTAAKALVEPLHAEAQTYWIVNPNHLEKPQ